MEHLLENMTSAEAARVVLLKDCMSAVGGFGQQAQDFFDAAIAKGLKVLTAEEARQLVMA